MRPNNRKARPGKDYGMAINSNESEIERAMR
jgi:hypothetical protein